MGGERGRSRESELDLIVAVIVLTLVAIGIGAALSQRLARIGAELSRSGLGRTLLGLAELAHRAAPVVIGITVLLVAVVLALKAIYTIRTLRSRVRYAVLPPPTFDPRPEATEAFAQQLLGVRRRVLSWIDRSACPVRIQLSNTPDGRVLYSVAIPRRFGGSLFNAFASAYPGVQLDEEVATDGR
jgi:hypothetical protein